jgi:hypothetical protein
LFSNIGANVNYVGNLFFLPTWGRSLSLQPCWSCFEAGITFTCCVACQVVACQLEAMAAAIRIARQEGGNPETATPCLSRKLKMWLEKNWNNDDSRSKRNPWWQYFDFFTFLLCHILSQRFRKNDTHNKDCFYLLLLQIY